LLVTFWTGKIAHQSHQFQPLDSTLVTLSVCPLFNRALLFAVIRNCRWQV